MGIAECPAIYNNLPAKKPWLHQRVARYGAAANYAYLSPIQTLRFMLRFFRTGKSPDSDAELLARFQRGGEAAVLAQLYDRYLELTYGLCLRYLGEATRAEDAVMGIFESLLQKVPDQQIGHFRNWLHSFVRNYCLMQLRRERSTPAHNTLPDDMQIAAELHPIEEWLDAPADPYVALERCIEQLPDEQRRCIRLFYLEDNTYKGIAELTQLEVGRVRSHIQNGRRNLRQCMEANINTHP